MQATIAKFDGVYNFDNINFESLEVAIVASQFNKHIVDNLITGAITSLTSLGVKQDNIKTIIVPGALEIPLAVQHALSQPSIAGAVALGTVIKGQSSHYDYVCSECYRGITEVILKYNKPVGYGVLTVENMEQAIARSSMEKRPDYSNKGEESALAMLSMINILNQ